MLKIFCCLAFSFLFFASVMFAQEKNEPGNKNMKILKIEWQRLLSEGQTCSRCGATEQEVEKASRSLEQSLAPLGIKVVLEKREITPEAFQKDPSLSNTILLNGRPLEEWLGINVGQSPCCGPCGDAECRTLESEGQVYETIPADLIIQAGLRAASHLVNPQTPDPCCQKAQDVKKPAPPCCSK